MLYFIVFKPSHGKRNKLVLIVSDSPGSSTKETGNTLTIPNSSITVLWSYAKYSASRAYNSSQRRYSDERCRPLHHTMTAIYHPRCGRDTTATNHPSGGWCEQIWLTCASISLRHLRMHSQVRWQLSPQTSKWTEAPSFPTIRQSKLEVRRGTTFSRFVPLWLPHRKAVNNPSIIDVNVVKKEQ